MDTTARDALVFVCEILKGQITRSLQMENMMVALLQSIGQENPELREEYENRLKTIALAPTRDASVQADDELRQIQRIIQRLNTLPRT